MYMVPRLNNHALGLDSTWWMLVLSVPRALSDYVRFLDAHPITGTTKDKRMHKEQFLSKKRGLGNSAAQQKLLPTATTLSECPELRGALSAFCVDEVEWDMAQAWHTDIGAIFHAAITSVLLITYSICMSSISY